MEINNLKLIILPNFKNFGESVDNHLKLIRNSNQSFITPTNVVRFNNSEGKVVINGHIIGQDVYILSDVGNYSETYMMYGFENHKSYDDHYQDIKRTISALSGEAGRINLITPLLYSSRQHKRKGNESLDCAMALHELEFLGVDRIITFDAHDATIQTSLNRTSFKNLYPTYSILKTLIKNENINIDNLLVISPDNGAVDRAIYYADVIQSDVGIFHKRRDYSILQNGKHPIVAHEYLGKDLDGKDVIIVDDMIASGGSMIDVAKDLKERGANKIFLITTFALFTEGKNSIDTFNFAAQKQLFNKLYTTNLSYIPEYVQNLEWINVVDCSKYLAKIIDRFNNNESIKDLSNGSTKEKILTLINQKRNGTLK